MAGKSENMDPMWAKLGQKLELEAAVPLHESVYLGNMQRNIDLPEQYLQKRREFISSVVGDGKTSPSIPKFAGG